MGGMGGDASNTERVLWAEARRVPGTQRPPLPVAPGCGPQGLQDLGEDDGDALFVAPKQ